MKTQLMSNDYDGELINDINDDIMCSLDKLQKSDIDEYGLLKGKLRVTVTLLSEDDCDCTGFDHDRDCPHWVMGY